MQNKFRIRKESRLMLFYDPLERTISLKNAQGKEYHDSFDQKLIINPVRAVIDINDECNADCSYCSQKYLHKNDSLSAETVFRTIDELEKMKVFELTLRGGEATMHPDFYKIWKHAVSKRFMSTTLITNGMLLSEKKALQLLQNPTSKIIVSLDGLEKVNSKFRDPKQFSLVMKWLKKLLPKKQDQLVVLSTLYKENYNQMPAFGRFLALSGLKYHHITTLKRMGGSEFKKAGFVPKEKVKKLELKLEKIKSAFPKYSPMISWRASLKMKKSRLEGIQLPLFTDCFSGTGLKIIPNGDVGISKFVFFTDYFKESMRDKIPVPLEPIGNISRKGASIKEIWQKSIAQRTAQEKVIDNSYDYYVGWKGINDLLKQRQ